MLEHALALAARGLRTFPCHSISDGECTCCDPLCASPGKHPRVKDWQRAATTDEQQIRQWWSRWPEANPAVATGATSGCFVVDIDPRNSGFASLEALLAERGPLPETFSVATGGGGAHLFYRHPGDERRWRKQLAKGVDIKGDGGYVVGAGALHASGNRYAVDLDAPIADAPPWLVDLASKPREAAAPAATPWAPIDHGQALADAREYARLIADSHEPGVEGEGGSVPTFTVAVLLYKGLGLPDDADTRAVFDRYLARCTPPWTDEEQVRHKIEGAKASDKRLGFKLGEFKVWRWAKRRGERRQARPVLKITSDEEQVADAAVAAIAAQQRFFDRGGALVDVVELDGGIKKLVALPPARVREAISSAVRLEKFDKRTMSWESSHVPDWLARAVASRGSWPGFRRIRALSTFPVLRPDGTMHDCPGWDPATLVLYAPTCELPRGPAAPTWADARAALVEVYDLVTDFPFEKPVHKSAWLAALLTPMCRPAFDGPAPLCFVDANLRSSGKTKLVDLIGILLVGREMYTMAPTDNEEETRKRITTIALGGTPMASIDNVQEMFGNAAMDMLLTRTTWSDRLLGGNVEVDCEVRTTWYATGNNVGFRGDTARRILHVRLQSMDERPEERVDFKYPHLLMHAKEVRPRVLGALSTILRAYAAAGAPDSGGPTWGSYEGWLRTVRDCIAWLGEPDPIEARHAMLEEADADRDASLLGQLIAGWEEVQAACGGAAISVGQALSKLSDGIGTHRFQALRDALSDASPDGRLPSAKSVGMRLRAFRKRPANGKMLVNQKDEHVKQQLWRVVPVRA